jgi:hypothetical protein
LDRPDRLLRKQADFENYRKRVDKEKKEFQQYALADFMLELIGVRKRPVKIIQNRDAAWIGPDESVAACTMKGARSPRVRIFCSTSCG